VQTDLRKRALRLEYLTVTAVTVEAIVGVAAGVAAKSIALIGFGLDSIIEFFVALTVVWQLRSHSDHERREDIALRIIAVTFFVLAGYIVSESIDVLRHHHEPETSAVGIVLTVGSVAVMHWLGRQKHTLGHEMENDALEADAAESLLCSYLAVLVLIGLVLNTAFSWWWADPVAALGIAFLAVREGIEAFGGGHHDASS
jgi:divalent metal cation (Fe/Co/Zn/Cd) transporter